MPKTISEISVRVAAAVIAGVILTFCSAGVIFVQNTVPRSEYDKKCLEIDNQFKARQIQDKEVTNMLMDINTKLGVIEERTKNQEKTIDRIEKKISK
jgi:peptidoglycan hydrolase CwlO-like protein